jgi:ornithine cyclodeaminase/alanine dehydrogenase-like protein (mu-crystallin family)
VLHLAEADVAALVGPADALEAVEAACRSLASGACVDRPRERLPLDGGQLAVMAATDAELGFGGAKVYAAGRGGASAVVSLFEAATHTLAAVLEADLLGRLRTGGASGVAARHLARSGARTLGVIGCGRQAPSQVACIREALPGIAEVLAWCPTREHLEDFCTRAGAEAVESAQEAAAQDVVVTITTSRDPVLRGDWLRPGALVCAAGANRPEARELDNAVVERAAFVCTDSLATARLESGDLIEPVASGALDWLEVHELHEIAAGGLAGRASDDDVVLFKSNGIAAWDVALAALAVRRARARS